MAMPHEKVFIFWLTDTQALAAIARMDLPEDLLPTETLRPIHHFALDAWHSESTEGRAPSAEMLEHHFGALLADHEINVHHEPQDPIEVAIEGLKGTYVDRFILQWGMKFNTEMSQLDILNKLARLDTGIGELMAVQMRLTGGVNERVDAARDGIGLAIDNYMRREQIRVSGGVQGLSLGFRPLDDHTSGIRDGELCVLAAPPKTGKSYFLVAAAYKAWMDGLVPVLFTLENSVEMTLDRIACFVMSIDSKAWQRGEVSPEDVEKVRGLVRDMQSPSRPLYVVKPPMGQRTMGHMIKRAKSLGDVALIDQLTFVEPNPEHVKLPRYQQIGHSLHELKTLISTGKEIPCVLAHQVNRDGQKAAEKAGRLEMYHMAEASEVERTADWVLGLWASRAQRDFGQCYLQMLASRRANLIDWEMVWRPWVGQANIRREVRLGGDE